MERKLLHRSSCVAAGSVSSPTRSVGRSSVRYIATRVHGGSRVVGAQSAAINPSVARLQGRIARCTYANTKSIKLIRVPVRVVLFSARTLLFYPPMNMLVYQHHKSYTPTNTRALVRVYHNILHTPVQL